jgi:hypothetical protein
VNTRRLVALVGCALLTGALATACGPDNATGGKDPGGADSTSPAVSNSKTLLKPDFDAPSGFTKDPSMKPLVPFSDKYESTFYQQDGVKTGEIVFVVSYLLDEKVGVDLKDQEAVVKKFDEEMSNTDGGIPDAALVNEERGVVRRAAFKDPDDKKKVIHQDNTFLFDGYRMIQIGCQWEKDYKSSEKASIQVINSLTFKR